ncbi:hypothetical protein LTR28_000659 [Elasticomyces elasticus]|nr:hypothetical protein LTR28_000659 [Elasticomyces elasticus]
MADSDPITDSTPKRRKTAGGYQPVSLSYDSQDDSGDELFAEHNTVATLPLSNPGPRLPYKSLMSEINSMSSHRHVTQPTQALEPPSTWRQPSSSPSVQVARSSPAPLPVPPQRSFKAPGAGARGGLLASAMAPPGTMFRAPLGIPKPAKRALPEDSEEDDPPINYGSSEDDTQGLRSNIKPSEFSRGGRRLDSSPNMVQESPQNRNTTDGFKSIIAPFLHNPSGGMAPQRKSDAASAYGSGGARPRPLPAQRQPGPAKAQPVKDKTLDDIIDFSVRRKIERMQAVYGTTKTVRQYEDALSRNKTVEDALDWLAAMEDDAKHVPSDSSDIEIVSIIRAAKPVAPVAPMRSAAKVEVKAPTRNIHDKWSNTHAVKPTTKPAGSSLVAQASQPRRRLVQGRKTASSSPAPSSPRLPSPPPAPKPSHLALSKRVKKARIPNESDEDEGIVIDLDDGTDEDEGSGVEQVDNSEFEGRLLHFFNTCSAADLADISNQSEEVANVIISKRPFATLQAVRAVSDAPVTTKSGKKSARKPVGDKIADVCYDMFEGYDAVDGLVNQCEAIQKPITEALRRWGVNSTGSSDGELELTSFDEAHDSGVGTPSSTCATDDDRALSVGGIKSKRVAKSTVFLKQPPNMSKDLVMKDYQIVGLNWLNLLWSKRTSCILADDMGLGKTCQVISFLAHLQEEKVDGVQLVVVPGSTLENWLREFQRFAPSLTVEPYYGSQTERPTLRAHIEDNFSMIDVVVTTYDIAVKPDDNKFLRGLEPAVCVYDEGHALKNPSTDRYKKLMRIKADFRILLTGTPLQNNLRELAALLAFIMPKMFREHEEALQSIFKYRATTKDTDHAALLSTQRIARAKSMITPFLLRRKKHQVLKDIPAKHRRVEYCDMEAEQAEFYESQRENYRRMLTERDAGKKGGKTSSNVLMALRKAAIHPLLFRRFYTDAKLRKMAKTLRAHEEYGQNPEEKIVAYLDREVKSDFELHHFCAQRPYMSRFLLQHEPWMDSGKVAALRRLLATYAAAGDRTLIFSQFTSVMNILEAVLESLGIRFMRLDGGTDMRERQEIIDQFSSAPAAEIPVFMLSTKAGGTGINLACANRIVVFDSSFNPQDDVQAENRAHRVGQTREVHVVRLVARGTVEEQILALGESKLALDERVAGEAGAAAAADPGRVEREGEKMVERMVAEVLKGGGADKGGGGVGVGGGRDLREEYLSGLKGAGLDVSAAD